MEVYKPQAKASGTARATVQEALDRLPDLISPVLTYRFYAIERVEDGAVHLASGQTLAMGAPADLLLPAEEALVAACTIGPDLDLAVQACFAQGKALLGLTLDAAGVAAVGKVIETAFRLAEERAGSRGCGVSPCLSPGSVDGWPLSGQKDLCELLPVQEIGLSLNENGLLIPYKSASLVVGMGPGYEEHAVGSLCHLCALAPRCRHRH
jgi:hypothetical protein